MPDGSSNTIVEALILASPEPLPPRKIAEVLPDMTPTAVGRSVAELNNRYMQAAASYRIRELAGGFQFYILPEFTAYVEELFTRRRKMRLTRAALETLAIIAYRQPVTRGEIEQIRGVASDGVLHNLLQKKVVTIKGRAATVGKPLQYGTTGEFLKLFGLDSLKDLPHMSEIEELISAREPQAPNQLQFEMSREGDIAGLKLNIADGTYDPKRTAPQDEDPDLTSQQPAVPHRSGENNPPDEDESKAADSPSPPSGVIDH